MSDWTTYLEYPRIQLDIYLRRQNGERLGKYLFWHTDLSCYVNQPYDDNVWPTNCVTSLREF